MAAFEFKMDLSNGRLNPQTITDLCRLISLLPDEHRQTGVDIADLTFKLGREIWESIEEDERT